MARETREQARQRAAREALTVLTRPARDADAVDRAALRRQAERALADRRRRRTGGT